MSDDDDDQLDSDTNLFDVGGTDSMGFGPLILTDSEKSLMERVRQELKHELKNVSDLVRLAIKNLCSTKEKKKKKNKKPNFSLVFHCPACTGLQGETRRH